MNPPPFAWSLPTESPRCGSTSVTCMENSLTAATLSELSLLIDRVARVSRGRACPPKLATRCVSRRLRYSRACQLSIRASCLHLLCADRITGRKIANLPFPTISLIGGRCDGVGLGDSLATSTRLVSDSPSTKFSFPAVDRGLIPCWGGSLAPLNVVGRRAAESVLLNGTRVDAVTAYKIGLADRLSTANRTSVDLMTLIDEAAAGRSLSHLRLRRRMLRSLGQVCLPQRWRTRHMPRGYRHSNRRGSRCLPPVREVCVADAVGFTRLAEGAEHLLALHLRASLDVRVVPQLVNPVPPTPRRIGIVGGVTRLQISSTLRRSWPRSSCSGTAHRHCRGRGTKSRRQGVCQYRNRIRTTASGSGSIILTWSSKRLRKTRASRETCSVNSNDCYGRELH